MEMDLDKLPLGKPARVLKVRVQEHLHQRLGELGFVPGTWVCKRYRTPGGSLVAVEFRGTVLALRSRDMEKIRVEII